jgi:hypothetical protein
VDGSLVVVYTNPKLEVDILREGSADNLQAKICAEQKYVVPLSLKLSAEWQFHEQNR